MLSLSQLHVLRTDELQLVLQRLPAGARVLEVGAGTGWQAKMLAERGCTVTAIDLPQSNHASARVFPVIDYDGKRIPFEDKRFDVVFSSNVLAHVPDLEMLHSEIRRVLVPGGFCLHSLPTTSWRLWTSLAAVPAALRYVSRHWRDMLPRPLLLSSQEVKRLLRAWWRLFVIIASPLRALGARGNGITELWLFRAHWWKRNFAQNGFDVIADYPMKLFYTGHMILAERCSLKTRRRLARCFGSSCRLYEVRPR